MVDTSETRQAQMNILIVRTPSRGGNANSSFYNRQELGLARAFRDLGHKCDVAYFDEERPSATTKTALDEETNSPINIFMFKGWALLDSGIFDHIEKLIENYDYVICTEYDQVQSFLIAVKHSDKCLIYHGPYFCSFNKKYNLKCKVVDLLMLPFYKRKNVHFLTKSIFAESFLKNKGLNNVRTVGVGLDINQLSDNQRNADFDFFHDLKIAKENGERLLLYVGKIEPRRNPKFLLDVFKQVKTTVNCKLVIVGNGNEEYISECKEYGRNQGLDFDKDVYYIKALPQTALPGLYKLCDVFLLPTIYEIFGMVLLEAMLFALPVVTTSNGGSKTLIENKLNGCIIEEFDVAQWAHAVCSILDNEGYAKKIGENASNKIKENYLWSNIAEVFLDEFSKLAKKN